MSSGENVEKFDLKMQSRMKIKYLMVFFVKVLGIKHKKIHVNDLKHCFCLVQRFAIKIVMIQHNPVLSCTNFAEFIEIKNKLVEVEVILTKTSTTW